MVPQLSFIDNYFLTHFHVHFVYTTSIISHIYIFTFKMRMDNIQYEM